MTERITEEPAHRKPCGCEWFDGPKSEIAPGQFVYPRSFKPCARHASGRITEERLREIEAPPCDLSGHCDVNDCRDQSWPDLIAEIRRLREMLATSLSAIGCECGVVHAPACPWPAMEEEARLIRAESAPPDDEIPSGFSAP